MVTGGLDLDQIDQVEHLEEIVHQPCHPIALQGELVVEIMHQQCHPTGLLADHPHLPDNRPQIFHPQTTDHLQGAEVVPGVEVSVVEAEVVGAVEEGVDYQYLEIW